MRSFRNALDELKRHQCRKMSNVMQVWMSDHPPKRGRFYKRPKVHAGFLKAWRANGLDRRVMNRIKAIFKTPGVK